MRLLMPVALLCAVLLAPGLASARGLCGLEQVGRGVVATIHDDGTLELADGRKVRLTGVKLLRVFKQPRSKGARYFNELARKGLELLRGLKGKPIHLRQKKARRTDRYNRLLAHVIADDGRWMQQELLSRGLARAVSWRDNRTCINELLALEKRARRDRRGLWKSRAFQPVSSDNTRLLMKKRYRFTLAEGRVAKVAQVKKWVFVNFGTDWRRDFTIAIKRKYARQMAREGLDPASLEGRRVRVRGWIEKWNGPTIKATHKEQIEVLGRKMAQEGGQALSVAPFSIVGEAAGLLRGRPD